MFNLDPAKILVVLVIGLIVIGPERLPNFARQLGSAWRTLTTYREQAEEEVRKVIPDLGLPKMPSSPRAAISSYLADLMRPAAEEGSVADAQEANPPMSVHTPVGDELVPRYHMSETVSAEDPSMN